jgi:hypothetical protein
MVGTVAGAANSVATVGSNKGITANCFYYDNTLHQLNINNNQHSDESKSLPGNSSFHQHMHNKMGDKFQCESYQDLTNRKSNTLTLNRLMSSSINQHSASTLSLVSSHNSTNLNSGSSAASGMSKLPQLNN